MFKKGESGNPGGRPKEAIHFTELAKKHSKKALEVLVNALSSENERHRIMAASIIIERAHGKPLQEIQGNFGIQVVNMPSIQILSTSGEAKPNNLEFNIGSRITSYLEHPGETAPNN